ncbi:MAG: G8 domain-containing protein [Amphiplicatus sp.]
MSFGDPFATAGLSSTTLEDCLKAARRLKRPPAGRRARRRAASERLREAGALAALLAVEGCLPIAPGDPEMTAPASPPQPASPPPASGSAMTTGDVIEIPVADLLAGKANATIVEITGAENGVAHLMGSVVHFTPAEGYSGPASISFTYRTNGHAVKNGDYQFTVEAAHQHDDQTTGAHEGHDDMTGGAMSGHDHGSQTTPHPDDPSKMAEHMALMALVPVAEATHVAVKSGSWFDPATWANGQVPGDGARVVIPEGVAVAYDGTSGASVFTVRVDGALNFATDRDTFLEVDTLVVTPSGHLTIGTADHPVAAGVQAVISIAANGPIDVAWDPMLLSRGVISHGSIDIHGAEKENFLRLAIDPMAGDTTLTVDGAPQGWRVGDRLVLTGTHLTNSLGPSGDPDRHDVTTEDEELVITAINGNVITVDRALQYNHEGARADLKAYVANYTRNVRIETEGGEAIPIHQRGHVMFMHSDNVDVRYAEFYELGRTDKSVRAVDVSDLVVVTPDSNVYGRFALHIHRAGVSDPDDPAMLVGCAVWGSPGWGVVHHDSNAILSGNAAYDVYGAAFVAETGNETGRWVDNIAIKSIGYNTAPKDGDDFHAFDQARNGIGFWFEGRLVDAIDNVAAGMPGGHGFVYMHRIPAENHILVDPSNALQSDKLRYADGSPIYEPNIGQFFNNEAIATEYGLEVVKPGPKQNHDVRSVIENFTAWENLRGVFLQYTGHYTLQNVDLVATDTNGWWDSAIGIVYGTNVFDAVVVGANIEGYPRGIYLSHESLFPGVTSFRYDFIDTAITGAHTPYVNLTAEDRILTSADLANLPLSYASGYGAGIIMAGPDGAHDPALALLGMKTDMLGTTETSTDWDPFQLDYWNLRGAVEQNGYWTTADGKQVTLVEEYVADRVTGDLMKVGLFVEIPAAMSLTPNANDSAVRVAPDYHGLVDLGSAAPVGVADHVTARAGEKNIFNVLANDYDPEGGAVSLDGLTAARHGHVLENEDGTVTYIADIGYQGADSFFYWVEDGQGKFTKTEVHVTVEI